MNISNYYASEPVLRAQLVNAGNQAKAARRIVESQGYGTESVLLEALSSDPDYLCAIKSIDAIHHALAESCPKLVRAPKAVQ